MSAARQHGLDTLRALAIVLVLAYHYRIFVADRPDLGWPGVLGWTGVDLFFVLSGYLIANQLFQGLARGQVLRLRAFWARRALRTLPLFWVVLAAYALWWPQLGGREPPPLWRFLSFTQNLGLQPGTAFSHAWSLCVEEQFYLVLPLLLVLGVRLGAGRAAGWALLAALTALGIGARAWLWTRHGLEAGNAVVGYHPNIYYATLCRFDEFLPGVALALLKNFHPVAWQRCTRHGQAVSALALLALAAMALGLLKFYYVDGVGYGFFMTAFGYSLLAWAWALLLLAALSPGAWLHRLRVPGAQSLALWSYAIYLSHRGVAHLVRGQARAADWPPLATWGLAMAACLAVGWLLHRGVEAPFMAWRDRRVPGSFAAPAAGYAKPFMGKNPGPSAT